MKTALTTIWAVAATGGCIFLAHTLNGINGAESGHWLRELTGTVLLFSLGYIVLYVYCFREHYIKMEALDERERELAEANRQAELDMDRIASLSDKAEAQLALARAGREEVEQLLKNVVADLPVEADDRQCVGCGCTTEHACIDVEWRHWSELTCFWWNDELCSRCAFEQGMLVHCSLCNLPMDAKESEDDQSYCPACLPIMDMAVAAPAETNNLTAPRAHSVREDV